MKNNSESFATGSGAQQNIEQPVVLISGGSSGIGFATAKSFCQ